MATIPKPITPPPLRPAQRFGFHRFAWSVLGLNLLVILWGALVRASGSGAGCGNQWPLCNGQFGIATIIEFTHRMTSGAALITVIVLYVWAFRQYPKGHLVRRTAALSVVLLFVEALLGAGLVLLQYVDKNESVGRAIYLSAHLVNTQLLLAALTMTAWLASESNPIMPRRFGLLILALTVSVTGAIAALAETLFPATSLSAGMRSDFSTTSHWLLRLRVAHPILALAAGIIFALTALSVIRTTRSPQAKAVAWAVALLVVLQLYAGAMNILLLAPVWMQLVHLLLADLLWIALVLLTLSLAHTAAHAAE